MSHLSRALFCLLLGATLAPAATQTVSFTVSAGKHDRKDEVVRVPVSLPKGVHVNAVEIRDAKGKPFAIGQVTHAGLASPGSGHELFFVLPALKAGATLDLSAEMTLGERALTFMWIFKTRQPKAITISGIGDITKKTPFAKPVRQEVMTSN